MAEIIATDRDGITHRIEAREGRNVMEILRDEGLPIEAICAGQCICSTCHVYVDESWSERLTAPAIDEQVMVEDSGHYQKNSRLACQIEFHDDLDGLSVTLAPEF